MNKLFILSILLCSFNLHSQNIASQNSAEILASLKKLNTLGSALYIAAHPDDENTRLLAYLSKEKKWRTGYLSLTRGDGGQNLIGKEQGELLGLIRTQELLAARKIDGAEQFFTRANDFGYSKNPEETFSIWNKDSILADVVLCIRKFKPDVIICRFPTTGEGGHGHHTASAILALEAFEAAADSTKFKDQLRENTVWKCKRIFWNTFNFGGTNTTAPNQFKIDVGIYNALLGKSYGEIAAESRSMHKSQGFGSAKARGESIEYFKILKGDSVKKDLAEGISQNWNRFNTTHKLHQSIEEAIIHYNAQAPEQSVPRLIKIYKLLKAIDTKDDQLMYWKEIKLKECEQLLLNCAGLWAEAIAADYIAVPGRPIQLTAQVIKRNAYPVKLTGISFLNQSDSNLVLNLKTNELYSFKHSEKINEKSAYSNPYWLNQKHSNGLFFISDRRNIGKAENDAKAKVYFQLELNDLSFRIERSVVFKSTDPVKGEVYRPLEVLPPVCITISDKVFVFQANQPKTISFTIKANAANVKGKLQVKLNDDWRIQLNQTNFNLKNKGDEAVIEATINPVGQSKEGYLQAFVEMEGETYTKSIKRIEYDHIPYQFILSDAEAKLVQIDLKKAGTMIGYIPGAGDDVAACLSQIGYSINVLSDELLAKEDLSKYDAIVTGVRAYNTNERLQTFYDKLMLYVQNGGNLIVQYNTNNRIGPVGTKVGPYPFTITRDRVTDENAEVRFLNTQHPVLNYPNALSIKDFDNWIQERGIYFAGDIDKNYQTIFSMNDRNEKANEGSLIIGKYGKGNFVYSGLAFFRELPAGVPGAYRLFVNLLSLSKNP